MGNAWLKNVRDRFWKRKVKVVFLGEYGSGKTTALYKLNINKDVNSIPSIGINIETLEFAGDNM
jgi:GTPase SAR1 family protein